MLIAILSGTPLWVWAVLAALVVLGIWQSRPRQVSPGRLLVLPLALLALGLWSMAPGFAARPGLVLAWLLTLVLALWWARRLAPSSGARWLADRRVLALPGSWMPLVVMLLIFSLRYASGVAIVLRPEWRAALSVQLPMAAAFGALSGLFMGRTLGLLTLAGGAAFRSARSAHG